MVLFGLTTWNSSIRQKVCMVNDVALLLVPTLGALGLMRIPDQNDLQEHTILDGSLNLEPQVAYADDGAGFELTISTTHSRVL